MAIYYILRQPVFLIGASGAIYAILFAYAVIFPKNKIYIWAIIPVQAPLLIVIYAVIELGSQIFGFKTGIGHISHLLGLVFAWIYLVVRMGINPLKVWRDAYRQ